MFLGMIKQGILENMRGHPYLPIFVTDNVTHFKLTQKFDNFEFIILQEED